MSELLGSFGDNELSPECLDGAQSFLKEDGISIPYEYTSYIAPISSSKLWNEVRQAVDGVGMAFRVPCPPFPPPPFVALPLPRTPCNPTRDPNPADNDTNADAEF